MAHTGNFRFWKSILDHLTELKRTLLLNIAEITMAYFKSQFQNIISIHNQIIESTANIKTGAYIKIYFDNWNIFWINSKQYILSCHFCGIQRKGDSWMIMQISRNTFKMKFKSSVQNMKRFLFLVSFAELIYLYLRNLIFKKEETGNLLRNKLA